MWEQVISVWQEMQSSLGWTEAFIALGFSVLFSLIVYLMYQLFYGSKHIGAGVHRMFMLGGPAITVLFLGIQTSIPLSLGLLGALSFVRFRTPVKDPAEIGFLLLLIASSVGSATGNFMVIALLFAAVFLALSARWVVKDRAGVGGRGSLMISVGQSDFERSENDLGNVLAGRLTGLRLQSMSVIDSRVNLQYHYRRKSTIDWTSLAAELNRVTSPGTADIFVG